MRIFWTLISLKPPKKTVTFHSTGCLIGILTMVYHNPHITGQYNLLYPLNNRQVFFHCSIGSIYLLHSEDSHLSSYLHIGWKPLGPRDPGVRGLPFGEPVKQIDTANGPNGWVPAASLYLYHLHSKNLGFDLGGSEPGKTNEMWCFTNKVLVCVFSGDKELRVQKPGPVPGPFFKCWHGWYTTWTTVWYTMIHRVHRYISKMAEMWNCFFSFPQKPIKT